MHGLDFISDSPKTYIFHKGSNKTNLGGILGLVYIIIFILISVAYILEYILNEKYEFSYFYKTLTKEEQDKKREEANQNIGFQFELEYEDETPLDDTYEIWDLKRNKIERNALYNKRINDLSIIVVKKCDNNQCNFEDHDKNKERYLHITYNGKTMEHENNEKPIVDKTMNFYCRYYLENYNENETMLVIGNWEVYNYQEKRGLSKVFDSLFGENKDYNFGTFNGGSLYYRDPKKYGLESIMQRRETGEYFQSLLLFGININVKGLNMYTRKAKSFIDSLANIASLNATIFSIMVKAFSMAYSSNFDNYKIMENILSRGKDKKKLKEIELITNNMKSDELIMESNLEKDIIKYEKKEELINNDNYENDNTNMIMKDTSDINNENFIEDGNEVTKLPKLRFFDFFFNNVYSSKLCVSLQKQKLISSCDEVLYKYFSVENILYNQILIENLMKDYKWNNPKLKSIHKNELIIDLKKYL